MKPWNIEICDVTLRDGNRPASRLPPMKMTIALMLVGSVSGDRPAFRSYHRQRKNVPLSRVAVLMHRSVALRVRPDVEKAALDRRGYRQHLHSDIGPAYQA